MRVKDLITGGLLIAAGAAIALEAWTFPKLAGMEYGPGLFPTIAALGMLVCGAAILIEARRAAALEVPEDRVEGPRRGPVLALLGITAAYALLLPWLGFHLTTAAGTFAAALIFGARPLPALGLSVVAPVVLHAIFYTSLRTPLPWGLLTPIAW